MTQDFDLRQWADRWGVPRAALPELLEAIGGAAPPPPPPPKPDMSEGWVQSVVRLDGARHDVWLYRNNVGALKDERGVPVRYGLANDSPEMNKKTKSGDLIGIRRVLIEQHHVGQYIGQFVSRECKKVGWTFKGTPHETAQANWAALINRLGGDAKFVTGEGSFSPSY